MQKDHKEIKLKRTSVNASKYLKVKFGLLFCHEWSYKKYREGKVSDISYKEHEIR